LTKFWNRNNDFTSSSRRAFIVLQAHDICNQLHAVNLSDLRGKTIGKVFIATYFLVIILNNFAVFLFYCNCIFPWCAEQCLLSQAER